VRVTLPLISLAYAEQSEDEHSADQKQTEKKSKSIRRHDGPPLQASHWRRSVAEQPHGQL
jgi:hypothetical protein